MLTELSIGNKGRFVNDIGKYIIHRGDCMEVMRRLESASVDVVVTDPPYFGFGFKRVPETYIEHFLPYVSEMLRCVKGEMADKRIAISQSGKKMALLNKHLPATRFMRVENAFADGRGADAVFLLRNELVSTKPETENWTNLPDSDHPNHRDVNKMACIIKATSREGETVLDPFCGSAAIGLAAVLLGRNFVGIELEEKRAAEAETRLAAVGATRLAI